jgi:hypothetical protein
MQLRLLPLAADLLGHFRAYLIGLLAQGLARALRQDLHHARALEIIEIVEGVVHAIAGDEHAVIGHEHDVRIAQRAGDTIALVVAQRNAAIILVIGSAAEEAHRVLIRVDVQPSALDDRERGCERHMRVQHDFFLAAQMHAAVDVECGGLDLVFAFEHFAVLVDQHQVGGRELRPVEALRIDEKLVRRPRHFHAEVIADPLVERHARGQPQGCGEIEAGVRNGVFAGGPGGFDLAHVHAAPPSTKLCCNSRPKAPRRQGAKINPIRARAAFTSAQTHLP